MTKLGKFCLFTPIKVLLISILLSIILPWVLVPPSTPPPHSNDMRGILCTIITLLNVLASIVSYSIAFNFYKSIRNSFFLSFLTFYSLAIFLFCVGMILLASEALIFISTSFLPFLIPQTYYFIRFRKRLKSGDIMDDYRN